MTLQLIGQLLEVKPTEQINKLNQKVTYGTDITIMFDGLDEEGFRKVTVETINVDEEYYEKLHDKKSSTILVSYTILHGAKGTYVFPDKSMPVLVLDKNPLDYSSFKRNSIPKSSNVKPSVG